MTLKIFVSTALLLLGAATPNVHAADPLPDRLPDLLLKELQRSASSMGMSAAIVRQQQLIWHGEAGFADAALQQPVAPETVFRLGSVSKFVTTAMLANMVERGRIDMARPVQNYLPDFPVKSHPFTIVQLATHTSGLPHYQPFVDFNLDGREAPYGSAQEALVIFQDRPLLQPPGTKYLYSSFGFNLISAVMEKAGKKDFPSLVDEFASTAKAPSVQVERMGTPGKHWSKLYGTNGSELARRNITHKWAAGGMLSNAHDLARAGIKVLDPAYISAPTLARFMTVATFNDGSPVRNDRFDMGLGWRMSSNVQGRRYVHHSGTIDGGRAHISVYPGEAMAVALLSNTNTIAAMDHTADALLDAATSTSPKGACREGERVYKGSLSGKDFGGTVRFSSEAGFCKITLGMSQVPGLELTGTSGAVTAVVGYSRAAEGTAYFVTPSGIFQGEASAAGVVINAVGKRVSLVLE